jgi:outer membrane protein W
MQIFAEPVTVEADSTLGFGLIYEFRSSQRLGVEVGMLILPFDFNESAFGMTEKLGDAIALPLILGLDIHLLGEKSRPDLYIGPLIAYTVWGNLEFSEIAGGGETELDDEFGFGAVLGLDVPFGSKGWQFNAGLRYLSLSAKDPSAEIDVDPLMIEVGFGYQF